MEHTMRRVAIEHFHKPLESLGYRPIKTADRTSGWRRSHYHLYTYPFGKKGIKQPPQRPVETATAKLHTQSNKPRKRHNARAAENPTKIQRNRTSKLSRVLLPEINKLTYNLIQIPNSAISHAHGS